MMKFVLLICLQVAIRYSGSGLASSSSPSTSTSMYVAEGRYDGYGKGKGKTNSNSQRLEKEASKAAVFPSNSSRPNFSFASDSGVFELPPRMIPIIREEVSKYASDASLLIRLATQVENAWFDAIAAYHPTQVGIYSRLGRRPQSETKNMTDFTKPNIAIFHTTYTYLVLVFPHRANILKQIIREYGLNPDDTSTDLTTPVGLGNVAARKVFEARLYDGMNQLGYRSRSGSKGGKYHKYNPEPFKDYTGYEPVNTPHHISDPSRWQPQIQRKLFGLYKSQEFATPQYAHVEAYTFDDARKFRMNPPRASNVSNLDLYTKQAIEVLDASAKLTDRQKLSTELFDDQFFFFAGSLFGAGIAHKLNMFEFVQLDLLAHIAAHDAGIVAWQEKRRFDAVRPFTAIRYLFGEEKVRAWGGKGRGTVDDITGNEWKSYLDPADHPGYPSVTACFCAAFVQAARLFLKPENDHLGWKRPFPKGGSRTEPGILPSTDTFLTYETWQDFDQECGDSRVWSGVGFKAAVVESRRQCKQFGDLAHTFLQSFIDGTAPPRPPCKGGRY